MSEQYEREADKNASYIDSDHAQAIGQISRGPILMRQPAVPGRPRAQPDPVERARAAAWMRCFRAYTRVAGIGPPPPPGRPDPAEAWQRRARYLVRMIFREFLNMDQVAEIVGAMRDRLGPGLQVVRAPTTDPECGGLRPAYVVGNRPPVHLCPRFFRSSADEQMQTMIHEAAHMAGIGEGRGNEYCIYTDCDTEATCGGFDLQIRGHSLLCV